MHSASPDSSFPASPFSLPAVSAQPELKTSSDAAFYFLEAMGTVPPEVHIRTVVNALVETHLVMLKGLFLTAVGTQRPLRYAFDGDHRWEPIVRELAQRLRQEGIDCHARYSSLPGETFYAVDIY